MYDRFLAIRLSNFQKCTIVFWQYVSQIPRNESFKLLKRRPLQKNAALLSNKDKINALRAIHFIAECYHDNFANSIRVLNIT